MNANETTEHDGDARRELEQALEHIGRAGDLLEEQGDGAGYVGEEHLIKALVALKNLTGARLEQQESESA